MDNSGMTNSRRYDSGTFFIMYILYLSFNAAISDSLPFKQMAFFNVEENINKSLGFIYSKNISLQK